MGSSVKTLITGRTYVACGSERFRKLNYKIGSNSNVSHLHILKRKPLPPIGIKQHTAWKNNNNETSYEEEQNNHDNQYSNKYHNHNKHSKNNPNKEEYESMVEKMQKHKT